MDLENKHIEQCTAEDIVGELYDVVFSGEQADDLVTDSLSKEYAMASGTDEIESKEYVSSIIELPVTLGVFLKRLFSTPAKVFGNKSMSQMFEEVKVAYDWLLDRVKGSEEFGIPKKELPAIADAAHLTENLRVLDNRRIIIDTTPIAPDGIDILAFLSSDKALTDTITEYTDTNYDWVYKIDRLTLFPNIKKATFNMKEINIDMLRDNTVIEEVHFPHLTKIDTSIVSHVIWNCANLRVIDMPNVEEIYGVIPWQNGVYMSAKGSEVMEFPKLKSCTCNSNAAMFHFYDCRVFKLPALETMYSANAAFLNGWENLEELYLTGLKAQGHGGIGSGGAGWHSQFLNMPKLRKVVYGNMLYDWLRQNSTDTENGVKYYKSSIGEGCPNLIHIEFDGKKESTWLSNWNPKYALLTEDLEEGVTDADGNTTTVYTAKNSLVENDKFETNLEQFLYNFQTYIADRFADMTGGTAPTLTLSYEVYTALENQEGQTILATLTDKNWNIASIPQIPTE